VQAVPDSYYEDLDPIERERLRNIIRSFRGESALLELSDFELDQALRFVTSIDGKNIPTFCGLLMIGKKRSIDKTHADSRSRNSSTGRN